MNLLPAGCVTQSKRLCHSEPDSPSLEKEKEIQGWLAIRENYTSLPGLSRN